MAIPQDRAYQSGMIAVCKITAMNGRAHDLLRATAQSRFKARRSAFTGSSGCRTTGQSRQGWSSGIPATTHLASTLTICSLAHTQTTCVTGMNVVGRVSTTMPPRLTAHKVTCTASKTPYLNVKARAADAGHATMLGKDYRSN